MLSSRANASYDLLRSRMRLELKKAAQTLDVIGYDAEHISPKEFYDYMTGETPTGDKTTINDVLSSEYLVLHEVVEMSELKKKGVPVSKRTVMDYLPEVYEAHYKAIEHEFNYAVSRKDLDWLRLRLTHAEGWLDDPYLPRELIKRCKSIIEEFSKHLVEE